MTPRRQKGSGDRQTHGVRQIDLASVQTAPSDIARDINRDIILELVRFKQPLARADLARLSGLRPSTVSAIVEQLIRENWVTEGAVIKPARGRVQFRGLDIIGWPSHKVCDLGIGQVAEGRRRRGAPGPTIDFAMIAEDRRAMNVCGSRVGLAPGLG